MKKVELASIDRGRMAVGGGKNCEEGSHPFLPKVVSLVSWNEVGRASNCLSYPFRLLALYFDWCLLACFILGSRALNHALFAVRPG